MTSANNEAAKAFDLLRPRLARIAYRMLGSVADADDVVQDAFIRWQAASYGEVRSPEAYLRRVVTRLCLDQLKSARVRHETYVGTWLPEPLVETEEEEIDDVTLPLMMALERLSPLERAAFLLHDVFDVPFVEIAETIDREEAACRQLARLARERLDTAKPRFAISKEDGQRIAEAFFAASRSGDVKSLQALLADDVALYADGGGKRPAALVPVLGMERVLAVFAGIAEILAGAATKNAVYQLVDGLPGFVSLEADGLPQTTALDVRDGKIVCIYVVRNPDKLRHLQ
jgi:RNA polymerase sigma-70 factor (ECF subfamily)